jgi:hypothetical protein
MLDIIIARGMKSVEMIGKTLYLCPLLYFFLAATGTGTGTGRLVGKTPTSY